MKPFNYTEAMKMRLNGYSYAAIGKEFKVNAETVRNRIGKRARGEAAVEEIKIPVLKEYFKGNNESIREFCRDICGNADYRSFNKFYQNFLFWIKRDTWTGTKKFTVNQMVRMLRKTGASIEDFYKEE